MVSDTGPAEVFVFSAEKPGHGDQQEANLAKSQEVGEK